MSKRLLVAIFVLAGCGSSNGSERAPAASSTGVGNAASTPAPTAVSAPPIAAGKCCCRFMMTLTDTGPVNHSIKGKDECPAAGGSCVDAASCAGASATGSAAGQ